MAAALVLGGLAACASAPPIQDVPSAETYYRRANELLEGQRFLFFFRDVDYAKAIELFQEVIDNYPYSDFATLAELRIADIHFDRENYEEALSYYQDFVELHPTHSKVPYAIFRNGLCAYAQMRDPDQDPTPTRDAIAQFDVLLERYPDSEDAERARVLLQVTQDHLARHEILVGDYYFNQGDYYAAVRRYRQSLSEYPSQTSRLRTMAQLAHALKRLHRYYEAERLYAQVLNSQPDEDVHDRVIEQLEEIRVLGMNGVAPLEHSCISDPNPACDLDRDALP